METTPDDNVTKQKVLELKEAGISQRDISRKLRISLWTVKYYCCPSRKAEKLRAYAKQWKKKNPLYSKYKYFRYRDINLKSKYSLQDMYNKIVENPYCHLTGDKIDPNDGSTYHLDHIIPISKGGSSELSNLGVCTPEANMAKHKLLSSEFVVLCEKVVRHHNSKIDRDIEYFI